MWRYCICDNCIHVHHRAFGIGVLHHPISEAFLHRSDLMAESKVKDENYFQVSGWMVNRLKLKGISLELFAIIYGFTQDGETEFTGSIQYLCDFTGTSRPTVINALKSLTKDGLLCKRVETINNVTFNRYKANLQAVKGFYMGSKETLPTTGQDTLPPPSQETLPNNISCDIKGSYIEEILSYLNEKSGKKYKSKSKDTIKHINARLAEGFKVEDFKTVIDKKCAEWLGTEFEQYLRPATLFGTKFEGYLNAPVRTKAQGRTYGANGIAIENKPSELGSILD